MSEKEIMIGKFVVVPKDSLVSFQDLLDEIDGVLMDEINRDESKVLPKLYSFFNSKNKPLDPREFFEFLSSLSIAEEIEYMDAGSALPDIWLS